MAVLSNKFDILRGWPNASAVAEDFIIGGTANHKHLQGQWVALNASIKDGTMTTQDVAVTAAANVPCYLVIEGRDDYSSQFANRVTCLVGGGYMVRLPQKGVDSDGQPYNILDAEASTFYPGQAVTVAGGVLHGITDGEITDADDLAGRALEVGRVIAVNSADNTIDIFVN